MMITEEILAVDDNKVTLKLLKMLLEREGYAVTCCPDALSAIEMAKEKDFSAFLIDYRMTAMNGVDATLILRRLHPEKRIIGYSIENRERDFLEAGADIFIRKDELSTRLMGELQQFSRTWRPSTGP